MAADRLLLRPEEVARSLAIGRTAVFELIRTGELRSVKIGKSRRIPADAVVEYVAGLVPEPSFGKLAWRPDGRGKRVATPDGVRVFGKAANKEGSVYRQSDGRWFATWWVPGEKRPRKASGKTQQEAMERRAKRQSQAGLDLGRLRTVGGLADWWLHNVHRHAVRPSSWSKSRDRVRRIKKDLGELPVVDLDYRVVTEWQSSLARTLAPRTVRHHRQTLAQVVDEAVKMGALVGNPVRAVKPLRVTESAGVALDRDETRALLAAVADHRLGAAVALLFLQGWRVSEVLGLAWEDVDLDAGTALVRRASVYVDGRGQQLGPPKTEGARGEHWLMPTVVEMLTKRREMQMQERVTARAWKQQTYRVSG